MTFGERLYELRKQKNISQEELAELLDVSRQSISKWENDKAYPEMTRLLFMSDYFRVSLDYLMRGAPTEENIGNTSLEYRAKNFATAWNSFISNLSSSQRILIIVLYILIVCVCIATLYGFIYDASYVIGKTLSHLQTP